MCLFTRCGFYCSLWSLVLKSRFQMLEARGPGVRSGSLVRNHSLHFRRVGIADQCRSP